MAAAADLAGPSSGSAGGGAAGAAAGSEAKRLRRTHAQIAAEFQGVVQGGGVSSRGRTRKPNSLYVAAEEARDKPGQGVSGQGV
jgi:hypothetical protein